MGDVLGLTGLVLGIGAASLLPIWLVRRFDKVTDDNAAEKIKARWAQEEAEDRAFHASAKRWPATVLSSVHWGEYNLRPLLKLRLRIEAPDGPFEVELEYAPAPQYVHRYGKGGKIHVYVDPNHREHVKCAAWEPAENGDET